MRGVVGARGSRGGGEAGGGVGWVKSGGLEEMTRGRRYISVTSKRRVGHRGGGGYVV